MKKIRNAILVCSALAACSDDAETEAPFGALLSIEAEASSEACAAGGVSVAAGRDTNRNGTLEASEVETTRALCHGERGDEGAAGASGEPGVSGNAGRDGANGKDGANGVTGEDGKDASPIRIVFSDEPSSANCPHGGVRVDSGFDEDGDGTLDAIEATTYICDGAKAASTVRGFRLIGKYTAPGGPIAEIISASPDGKTLVYTSSSTRSIGIADITDPVRPSLLGTIDVGDVTGGDGEPTSLAFAPDGKHVVVVVKDTADPVQNTDPGYLVVVDIEGLRVVGQVALGVGPDSVALTPDGTKAVVAIEDEESEDGNNAPQARTGGIQIVTLNYADPSQSVITDVELPLPTVGNMPTDLQPEYVSIDPTGKTAIVSLQENNLIAVIDIESASLVRYIDAGRSVHARADLKNDKAWNFSERFEGQLQPDGTCFLPDGVHFVTANEGDTPNNAFDNVYAGGRGFSVFNVSGERVYDSGDVAEWAAFRAGAYPDGRSGNRGVEPEGCGADRFAGTDFAFITGERNSSVLVLDMSQPALPAVRQVLGAPNRPESVATIPARGLFVVGGEGDGESKGGGIWLYEAVTDAEEVGHGEGIYEGRTSGTFSFGALSALTYQASTNLVLGLPDNAYAMPRIWSFAVDHGTQRLNVVDELILRGASGAPLDGIDPEGLAINPEGGFVVATEGVAGNGGAGATCQGNRDSNRVLFFTPYGSLDTRFGNAGVVDLPCGAEHQAFDWARMGGNGFEGVAVVDSAPQQSGGLKVYVAFQRPLTGEQNLTRIGEYDVDLGEWNFYYYPLDADVGGVSGNTFLSELIHVEGDLFAVIERDQGYSHGALNKTIRTFRLSTGARNDLTEPVSKALAADLLAHAFRFDQEKLEGLALGGGSLFVVNDNDGGTALNFFMRLSPSVLFQAEPQGNEPEPEPEGDVPEIVINEVNSSGQDFVELFNVGAPAVDLSGFRMTDDDPTHIFTFPEGTVLEAGGYLVIEGDHAAGSMALTYGLGQGDSVVLYTKAGQVIDSQTWSGHAATASRCPDGTGALTNPRPATKGQANDCL